MTEVLIFIAVSLGLVVAVAAAALVLKVTNLTRFLPTKLK